LYLRLALTSLDAGLVLKPGQLNHFDQPFVGRRNDEYWRKTKIKQMLIKRNRVRLPITERKRFIRGERVPCTLC